MEIPGKTKLSAEFIFTRLAMVGTTILCITQYLKEKKVDGLYTELWFLGIILFSLSFVYFSLRPKVSFDESTLYFKKFNKPEIQIPIKNITSIFRNPFIGGDVYAFEIEYLSAENEVEKIKFQTDSLSKMEDFQNLVIKNNPSVEFD